MFFEFFSNILCNHCETRFFLEDYAQTEGKEKPKKVNSSLDCKNDRNKSLFFISRESKTQKKDEVAKQTFSSVLQK